ncbi:MAG: dienelactone hydrolase family protein [Actinomycetia bacterium]|nr:dienelactone hydrolase family protein [Actinomycetes bacterium]
MHNEIAGYGTWATFVRIRNRVHGDDLTNQVAAALGVPEPVREPAVFVVSSASRRGVTTSELSWPVQFGPDLHAWLLHPTGVDPRTLPGVLALHSHAGIKSIGAARIVAREESGRSYREAYEGGEAFADRLAEAGFAVLAPDAFSWGSRQFRLHPVPDKLQHQADLLRLSGVPEERWYDELAAAHEHLVAKFAGVIGTSYAGMVAHDDLSALSVLKGACNGHVSVAGFSAGGARAMTLAALAPVDRVSVVAMMATWESLVPDYVAAHSWLLHTPGFAQLMDLPDLAAARRQHELQVVYCEQDPLFPVTGMRDADARLRELFADGPGSYQGFSVPTGHEFGPRTQDLVIQFLSRPR